MLRFLLSTLLFSWALISGESFAATYKIHQIIVEGSQRIANPDLAEMGLAPGAELSDHDLLAIEQELVETGLFTKVMLRLVPQVEEQVDVYVLLVDDPAVVGQKALGLVVAPTLVYSKDEDVAQAAVTVSGLSRNLQGYKLFTSLEMDARGVMRQGQLIGTTPERKEPVGQLIASARVYDPRHRFLAGDGFGTEYNLMWRGPQLRYPALHFGFAYWGQGEERFRHPFFTRRVAGPSILYQSESRQLTFFPEEGLSYSGQYVFQPVDKTRSALRLKLANTTEVFRQLWLTVGGTFLYVTKPQTVTRALVRAEGTLRFVPKELKQLTKWFGEASVGRDHSDRFSLKGQAYSVGLDYRGRGLVAQVAFLYLTEPKTGDL